MCICLATTSPRIYAASPTYNSPARTKQTPLVVSWIIRISSRTDVKFISCGLPVTVRHLTICVVSTCFVTTLMRVVLVWVAVVVVHPTGTTVAPAAPAVSDPAPCLPAEVDTVTATIRRIVEVLVAEDTPDAAPEAPDAAPPEAHVVAETAITRRTLDIHRREETVIEAPDVAPRLIEAPDVLQEAPVVRIHHPEDVIAEARRPDVIADLHHLNVALDQEIDLRPSDVVDALSPRMVVPVVGHGVVETDPLAFTEMVPDILIFTLLDPLVLVMEMMSMVMTRINPDYGQLLI